MIEPVDNRWNGTANQKYRVIEPNKFQQLVFVLLDGATCPKHYVITVIASLIGYIHSQLNHADWSGCDQIASSSVLISSIRSSLVYLRDQADYVSFYLFAPSRLETLIKESFCYLRKQNEMSLAEAMQKYAEQGSSDCEAGGSVTKPNLFKTWTAPFKREKLPKILAGVAAVWSVMVSEDVSSTGKFFKPHCIQVLCVLRLLGSDSDLSGVSKQLAQVLTGQGKSLVLALIATILALTGHEIQLVCYNEYLVKRDAKDFADLYELFGVKDAIQYGTFDNMANAIIAPEVDGKRKSLRSFVMDLVLEEPDGKRPNKPKAKVQDNSVLLMDEVDVFFTEDYYGSVYCPTTYSYILGLEEIQAEIWYAVNNLGEHDVQRVTSRIETFMSSSPRFGNRTLFSMLFLSKRGAYDLLVNTDNGYVRKSYTNKSLFAEHLNLMISNAIQVATKPSQFKDYKLNHEGAITRKIDEKWETGVINDYLSTFNYFRLKKDYFIRRVSTGDNYGYLYLGCGSISYAMLPKAFPLILGVTGTLTSLNQYEKATIERLYNITKSSIMPTFFGCSNNRFNPTEDFTLHSKRPLWLGKIFSQAYAAVTAKRAVLIFFFNGNLLEEFRAQYCGQLDRLQVLTENTPATQQEHLINEAGIAKTVTLATRGMGRGVDYKSSVAVEKSGGVHVIQTFFSLDVREETQIRGRTARKDNRGSYELIVYDVHLKAARLVEATGRPVSYAQLDAARASKALNENRNIEESIRKNTEEHAATMEFLQSFFK
ncbi:protein translocase subunit SecA-like [Culex pipiens pallens]|uniref:protein translocase subunit SecA-like n=1 Tax=Culex pipiens pallens TaxID=42434 RepID=UPI0022AB0D04|nr:protein translocase subunit SecA-like [Culex pipiens pallens]